MPHAGWRCWLDNKVPKKPHKEFWRIGVWLNPKLVDADYFYARLRRSAGEKPAGNTGLPVWLAGQISKLLAPMLPVQTYVGLGQIQREKPWRNEPCASSRSI